MLFERQPPLLERPPTLVSDWDDCQIAAHFISISPQRTTPFPPLPQVRSVVAVSSSRHLNEVQQAIRVLVENCPSTPCDQFRWLLDVLNKSLAFGL